ncbi:MAG: hypothetical protein ACR2LG_07540 [Actinomycetota bacterium]
MKNTKIKTSGDVTMLNQYSAPSTGPSCQIAKKLRPDAANIPRSRANGTMNESAIRTMPTDLRIHTAPTRITAKAAITGAPFGPHHRYCGNTFVGPTISNTHTRPMFEGLKMCLPPGRMR